MFCGRDPERIFGSLRPLLPPTTFPTAGFEADGGRQHGFNQLWHGWLALMVLCPRLFCAFSRFWIPTLSVEEVQSWRMKSSPAFVSSIWTPLVVRPPKTLYFLSLPPVSYLLTEMHDVPSVFAEQQLLDYGVIFLFSKLWVSVRLSPLPSPSYGILHHVFARCSPKSALGSTDDRRL